MPQPVKDISARTIHILGIESSCDETAAAVLRITSKSGEHPTDITVLSDIVASQHEAHTPYGGVVPEIAARAHVQKADHVIKAAMSEAKLGWQDLEAIAATSGPGLIGGVMVGMMSAKAIALAHNLAFIPVNHLEGHALSPQLHQSCPFPYLLLLVSGGHCQFIEVRGLDDYRLMGSTLDDAAGEAFDKVAKMLDLGFPGGPAIERIASEGAADAFDLPRPLLNREGLDVSFAGLKTAVLRLVEAAPLNDQRRADIAASFQTAITDCLMEKTQRAMRIYQANLIDTSNAGRFVMAGGVASNQTIRARMQTLCDQMEMSFYVPPQKWCTDNAAMIALAGGMHFLQGKRGRMDAPARARWPLDEVSAQSQPKYGSGRKGAKV